MIKPDIFVDYKNSVKRGLDSIDYESLTAVVKDLISTIRYDCTIFTCGNGASASISEHWACDWTKGSWVNNKGPRVISLSSNVPLISAIANDISYDDIYSLQLERLAEPADTLVVISSSGNSPNVVKALEAAKRIGVYTIALTGFDGGKAKELADFNLHVDCQEYEATEDCHSFIMQCLAKYIREELKHV